MPKLEQKVKVDLEQYILPLVLVRAQLAGEIVGNLGGSDQSIEIVQKGVSQKYIEQVVIYGIDIDGYVQDDITLTFNWSQDSNGEIMLDLDNNQSTIDAMDHGLGATIRYQKYRFAQRGLRVEVSVVFRKDIYADPALLAKVQNELGTVTAAPPEWKNGYAPREILNIRPGKDKEMSAKFRQSFRR